MTFIASTQKQIIKAWPIIKISNFMYFQFILMYLVQLHYISLCLDVKLENLKEPCYAYFYSLWDLSLFEVFFWVTKKLESFLFE